MQNGLEKNNTINISELEKDRLIRHCRILEKQGNMANYIVENNYALEIYVKDKPVLSNQR